MPISHDSWLSLADAFHSAAIDGQGWSGALERLAASTGSRSGQLVGLGSPMTAPFNWVTGTGPEWGEEFFACGGADPGVNPNVRAAMRARALEVVSSEEFITRDEQRRNSFMNEFAKRHDTLHICLTPLIKEAQTHVGLAVMRSQRQGNIRAEERAVFASIAPHVRAAVRMQMALEHQGAQVIAGALEALSLAVFICDRTGKVRAMTPAAETLVTGNGALRLRHGIFVTHHPANARELTEAVAVATGGLVKPGAPASGTVLIRANGTLPLALDILPLPRKEYAFGFEPRALVLVRGAQAEPTRMKALLQAAYGLTQAEVEVTLSLAGGSAPEAIAAARGTSVGTVRAQVRAIYAKLGVHRQSELISRFNQLR